MISMLIIIGIIKTVTVIVKSVLLGLLTAIVVSAMIVLVASIIRNVVVLLVTILTTMSKKVFMSIHHGTVIGLDCERLDNSLKPAIRVL